MSAIAIDWSGAKQPAAKIWMACARDGHLDRLEAIPTRAEAIDQLGDALSHDRNSVAGLDFAFSFPAWFLRSCETLTVFDFWAVVAREGERWLHACAPPFWGRPGKKKPVGLVHYRRTEELLRQTEQLAPKSCFQIGGAGSVGTGSIRGIPYLSQLREAGIAVWPFDRPRRPLVVEIYPRLLTGPPVKNSEAERTDYFAASWITLASEHRDAAACDNAFDAAISALVMDRHIVEFEDLPLGDRMSRLEGEVWTPRFTLDEVFKASPRSHARASASC